MGIRKYKPTTPGRRGSSVADFVEVTRSTPEKSLVRPLSKTGGRWYDATVAEFWFATEAEAKAAGFTKAGTRKKSEDDK